MSDTPRSASFARTIHWALDSLEPVVELLIRGCGWSAILFVFAIFFFVFREAVPAFWGDCAEATVVLPGQNNNLVFSTRQWTRDYNETKIEFRPVAGGAIAFHHDAKGRRLTVDFDPAASTANDVVDALATDDLNQVFSGRVSEFDDKPNDGTGLVTATDLVLQSQSERISLPGPNNDLSLIKKKADWWGKGRAIDIVLNPTPAGPIAVQQDAKKMRLTIDFDPAASTANDIVAALAASELRGMFDARVTKFEDAPNDGTGWIASSLEATSKLSGGRPPLDVVNFVTSPAWRPDSEVKPTYGILALLVGTVSVAVLAMVIAVPLGLGAAVYVSEFACTRVKETLKVVIELLAAIPSVVWGFIGYMVLGPIIIWGTGAPVGINILNGGIILALMSVPIIVSVSEDAMRAVPDSYREAATAMGASRWEIVFRVLFPAAKNGLLAAVLLGVGRAIGETMAVLMATGHSVQLPKFTPLHPVEMLTTPVRTMTATIAAELGETVAGGEHYRVLFVIGVVLFAVAFVVNLTADLVVKGIRGEQND